MISRSGNWDCRKHGFMVMTCYDLMHVEKVMAHDPFSSRIGFKGSSLQLNG